MNSSERTLRWVILDCAVKQWDDPLVRDLFQKVIQLKLLGYRSVYPENVLPIDTTDYIANHQILCEEDLSGGLHPLLASRSITLTRCQEHGLPFSGLGLAGQSTDDSHAHAVKAILADCGTRGAEITYDSSWTIHPSLRSNREFTRVLKEMYTAIFYQVHQALGVQDCLMGGVIRFRTHQFFEKWGANSLSLDGKALPHVFVKSLMDEEVRMLYLKGFSEEARNQAALYQSYWNHRLLLTPQPAKKNLLVTPLRQVA